jgi:hypothetical protein
MHKLATVFTDLICNGLTRAAVTNPARWAKKYRILGGKDFPGNWSFKYHPWLKGMHETECELNVGQKSAQMGYSEWALNMTFYKIDIEKTNSLYVLPNKSPDATDFSASRFDPALELSPYLKALFSDVQNIGHKRAGSTNLYIRGSRSRSGLKSVPCGFIVLDELDEMDQENIPLVQERSSGQLTKMTLMLSTPTIPEYGINSYFKDSTQEHYFFRCPSCSRFIELVFPDNFNLNTQTIQCNLCKATIDHQTKHEHLGKGCWVAANPNAYSRGFYINQLYSPTVKPHQIYESYIRGLKNPADMQEFENSKMGRAYVPPEGQLTDAHINSCIKSYQPKTGRIRTLGCDVGKFLHTVILEWEETGNIIDPFHPKLIFAKTLNSFEDLNSLVMEYLPDFNIIDANPERRKSHEFVTKYYGRALMCFYSNNTQGRHIPRSQNVDLAINVDRSYWLDTSLSRVRLNTISFPPDLSQEYRKHLKALIKLQHKDREGNISVKFQSRSDDHFAHSQTYAEIALQFVLGYGTNEMTESPL